MDLKNKVVFITGASNGIGKAAAVLFAKAGARLALTYHIDEAAGRKTAEECRSLGAAEVILLQLDITANASIENAVEKIAGAFRHIDVLVNNAGVIVYKNTRDQSLTEIEYQTRVNLEGLMKVTRTALPYVMETIINIASGAGKTASAGLVPYSASKFGVRGFTQGLALEEPALKIYSVNPGTTATRMTDYAGVAPEKVAEIILKTAQGEISKPSGADIDTWEYNA